jgi:hypothetical protein
MRKIKKRTALKDAREGMVLAAPVFSPTGIVLVTEGALLTRTLIASLGRKGITHVDIEVGRRAEWTKGELEAMEARVRQDVLARFREEPAGVLMETVAMKAISIEAEERLKSGEDH